ncbi:MAG: hypothetical protein A2X86_08200 [Bdellovibrionales bacterium GWA2_49_15]|nr:MAG: hypothetical protein A2X86_08200 [Bdellovibrionales bacterium GWA2_49_15]HAZ13934.1 hypothetical protein [Bdellovibrionales bacterium]
MDYDEFEAKFVKENFKLKIALAVSLIIFSIGTASILLEKRYYLYKGGALFEERPLAEEVCRQSFNTLAEGNPNPNVVSSGIIELAKKESFSLSIEKIYQVKSLEVGACKIILKSDGKLMAFKVALDGNNSNPFYYKLNQIDEIPVPKEEI